MTTNEQLRLDAVRRFLDIGESIDKDLADVVNLAAEICETPISLITLIDADTEWIKAAKGINSEPVSRTQTFCQYTIQQEEILEIPDATLDVRVNHLDAVVNDPNIRFYAGASLVTHDGNRLGSLCVLDTQPRKLTKMQCSTLKVLARQVVHIMELSRSFEILQERHERVIEANREAERSQIELKAIFDSSSDLFLLLGKHLEALSWNKALEDYVFKVTGQQLKVGDFISEYVDPALLPKFIRFYSAALKGTRIKKELRARQHTPNAAWMETSFIPVHTDGKILGVAINAADITERKRHEQHIKIQNEALSRIATMQSHEIRKPVATLMGLVELIKMDSNSNDPDYTYLDMISATVNELNEKICDIVSDSETMLHTEIAHVEKEN
ncbi:GAF domain-containing protein [Mucilaginibacter ginkgonis]|uniref:histidine kinase n=1 Tax=Mucilaginibacter ginkgonis TaxID=2682091 RepID=A0A6I4HU03_9SPHI|nr:GAF domain-containing protein [Mucilaginibacter ginkgonis]QQL50363.1 PAS domain-containing protein [Mucilaginibacter ginkgonis]